MGIFKFRDAPGPGVDPGAPPKKGIARFFEIVGRHFGVLVKLNLLFALALLPALALLVSCIFYLLIAGVFYPLLALGAVLLSIPLGGALTTLLYLLSRMLRDDPFFLWHESKKVFRQNFWPALPAGLVFSALTTAQTVLVFYLSATGASPGLPLLALLFATILLPALLLPYYFLQQGYLVLSVKDQLRNSLLLAVGHLPRSLAGALLGYGLVLLQFWVFPYSAALLPLLGFALPALITVMGCWPVVDGTFDISRTLAERAKGP